MKSKAARLAALTGLLFTGGAAVWANDTANDADSLILTVAPNVDYGVDITTTPSAMNLGSVDLYASTFTVLPATVTFLGDKAGQELDLTASVGSDWKFDVSPSTWATNGEQNAVAVYALFTSTTLVTVPSGADFANGAANAAFAVDAQSLGSTRVGGSPGNGTRFESQGAGTVDMDSKNPGDKAHLWFLLRMPSQTTTGNAQNISVTLTATISSL